MNRREFFNESARFAAGGVVVSGVGPGLFAQTKGTTLRGPDRYRDSFIFERRAFAWPGGKTLAIWIIPNVEIWDFHSEAGAAISPQASNTVPDIINTPGENTGCGRAFGGLQTHWIPLDCELPRL
jgi:hypothetical protein